MDEKAQSLLTDIVKLLHKHGPEAFSSLSKTVSEGEFLRNLESILAEAAKGGERAGIKNKNSQSKKSLRRQLLELTKEQPEKGQLLIDFHDGLSAKRYLPKLRDVRNFVVELDLPEIKATSRANAVGPLVRALCELPLEELKSIFTEIRRVEHIGDDRSLAGWSNLILRGPRHLQSTGQEDPSNSSESV